MWVFGPSLGLLKSAGTRRERTGHSCLPLLQHRMSASSSRIPDLSEAELRLFAKGRRQERVDGEIVVVRQDPKLKLVRNQRNLDGHLKLDHRLPKQ